MVVLRCTQRLRQRLRHDVVAESPRSTTVLGDWYGNVVRVGRRQILFFLSERTRLPLLLPIRDLRRLESALPEALASMLTWLRVAEADIAAEIARTSEFVIARTNNRSVLGTMNDFAFGAQIAHEQRPDESLAHTARWLAVTPIMPLDGACPVDLTRVAFGLEKWPWARGEIPIDDASLRGHE